jgi:hypothetical protein
MLPITVAQFRIDFSEFADPSLYPDSLILFWMTLAVAQVQNACRWGTLLPMAQELVTAHYVALAARDRVAGANGTLPGVPYGLAASETVGPVSVSYDYADLMIEGASAWNLTTYGQRYFALVRLVGAGGIQLPFTCFPICYSEDPGDFNPQC